LGDNDWGVLVPFRHPQDSARRKEMMASTATHCGFCRRITDAYSESGSETARQDATEVSRGQPPPLADVLLREAYCSECDMFYRQLVTYGRGDLILSDRGLNEPPPTEAGHPRREYEDAGTDVRRQ